jgi:8-oxo-dGTP pyrophosphatase MutT (NUDIX family)
MTDLTAIADTLEHFTPNKHPDRRLGKRSAVTLLLYQGKEPSILMIERAQREGDPWSGHMAFPGGRMDDTDDHSYGTAIRECDEEIGLNLHDHGRYLGRLSDLSTHIRHGTHGMWVTPFVFSLDEIPPLQPNYEVADIVWVPLSFLADEANRDSMALDFNDKKIELACYYFEGKCIWGLSLGMLDELLAVCDLAHFPQPPRAVENNL